MKRTLPIAAAVTLAATLGAAQGRALKVYVSVDMEGISGVVSSDQVNSESLDYAAARRWMAGDVNAVIAGLVASGATEIVVNDSHGGMTNLLPEDLRPEASLISGTPKPLAMMAGIDGSFDACLFVGYHSQAGTEAATLDHTISGATVHGIKVNGVELPELGLNAAIAGHFGVPVIMLSGDAAVCRQATSLLGGGVVTVAVKEAFTRSAAKLLPLAESRRRLEAGAREALANRARNKPFRIAPPYRVEVAFLNSGLADRAAMLPGVVRADARTLAFSTSDYLEGFKTVRALVALASTR